MFGNHYFAFLFKINRCAEMNRTQPGLALAPCLDQEPIRLLWSAQSTAQYIVLLCWAHIGSYKIKESIMSNMLIFILVLYSLLGVEHQIISSV